MLDVDIRVTGPVTTSFYPTYPADVSWSNQKNDLSKCHINVNFEVEYGIL